MNLENIFLPTDTIDALDATSKRRVLSDIAAAMAASRGLDAKAVFDVLHERERLGSTAIGGGVAIPHAKIAGLTELAGFITRLATPVEFEAIDDEPVDLIVTLLAPDTGGAEHLRVLARLSRLLRDPHKRAALRACPDGASLWETLTAEVVHQQAA